MGGGSCSLPGGWNKKDGKRQDSGNFVCVCGGGGGDDLASSPTSYIPPVLNCGPGLQCRLSRMKLQICSDWF